LAQEVREIEPAPPEVTVHVIRVEFLGSNDSIPADARNEISTELRNHLFKRDADGAYLKDLANEIAEVGVKGALQNRGFFKAAAAAKLTPIQSAGADINAAVSISVTPGPQYRMGDVRIEPTDSEFPLRISAEVVRGLLPLQRGELFSVERVITGLDNCRAAYVREGYVDMTAEPTTEIDEAHETIDMVIKIDQGLQYRVGSIEVLGVNTATREKLMESFLKPGEVFDGTGLEKFFRINRPMLPADATIDDVKVTRDVRTKTVAISFDLRTCPPN
jgi:outer membrane protein assembly factor BamA